MSKFTPNRRAALDDFLAWAAGKIEAQAKEAARLRRLAEAEGLTPEVQEARGVALARAMYALERYKKWQDAVRGLLARETGRGGDADRSAA